MTAVNWDFFGKQSSLNDLTKFILVPPCHSLPFDSISQLLIYVGRSDCFHWLGMWPVPQELWTGVTSNFCLSCLSWFSQGGSWILQTRHRTEVNCSDLREHNNLHLTDLDLRDLWEFSVRLVLKLSGRGTGVIQTIRWY